MAIAAPLLILLVFGILEFGLAFQDRLTVSNGTQSAGRVAAALGNNEDADIATLQAVEQSLGILPNAGGNVIKHVQIWKSNGSGAILGGGCGSAGSGTANCNWYVYTPTVDPNVCDWTPCPDPSKPGWSYGGGFIPANRDVTLDDDGLDVVGVTVLFSHNWLTGVLPIGDVVCTSTGTNCWADTALFRLEPQNFGS
jgi:hypothetical protein